MVIEVSAVWGMGRSGDTIHFDTGCPAYRRATRRKGYWTWADWKTRRVIDQTIAAYGLKKCGRCWPREEPG